MSSYIYSIRNVGSYSNGHIIGIKTTNNLDFFLDERLPKENIYTITNADSHVYDRQIFIDKCIQARELGYIIIIDELWSLRKREMVNLGFPVISYYQIFNPIEFETTELKPIKYNFHYCVGGVPSYTSKRFDMTSNIFKRYYKNTKYKSLVCFGNYGKTGAEKDNIVNRFSKDLPMVDFISVDENTWFKEYLTTVGVNLTCTLKEGGPRLFTHACSLGINTFFQKDILTTMGEPDCMVMNNFKIFSDYDDLIKQHHDSLYTRGKHRLLSESVKLKAITEFERLGYKTVELFDNSYYLCTYNYKLKTFHNKTNVNNKI